MKKTLLDMHTHSTYSHDGQSSLKEMLETALQMGLTYYGVCDHFNYDYDYTKMSAELRIKLQDAPPEEYFHGARHLQEDYAGCLNVIVGAEFGYSDDEQVKRRYQEEYRLYQPDYVMNSVHGVGGEDFCYCDLAGERKDVYQMYLGLIRRSLDAPYPYDIVGHIEYVARYVPFAEKSISLEEFGAEMDDILQTIISKDKILEVNTSTKTLPQGTLPNERILRRYYELGGRKISFGSDAHSVERILDKWEQTVETLKKIGFTYLTVPIKGEYIKVEI